MGCGPSRESISRFRLSRRKQKAGSENNVVQNNHHESDNPRKKSPNELYDQRQSTLGEDIGIAKKRIANKIRPISGPLQPPAVVCSRHRSSSQTDFFRMLDEKIASGRDYNSEEEEERSSLIRWRSRTNSFKEGRRRSSASKGSSYSQRRVEALRREE